VKDLGTVFNKIKELTKTMKDATSLLIETGELLDPILAGSRLMVCNHCFYKKGDYCGEGNPKQDKTCGCYLPAKVKLVASKCPYNKW
jgi:hypothetical protein